MKNMLENRNHSNCENINKTKNEDETIKEEIDLNLQESKQTSCQVCQLTQIGNNQVGTNDLRGCRCNKLAPYYRLQDPVQHVQTFTDETSPLKVKLDHQSLPLCSKDLNHPQHEESGVAENIASSKNQTCFEEAKTLKKCSFEPPQGMDTGQFPRKLFYQYYPNKNENYTYNVLPLPFLDLINYQEMRSLSMDNEDNYEKWKEFLYNLPNSTFKSIPYTDERFWRWEYYLRYKPNEIKTEFRYKMKTGPQYDSIGRLPITGEDLQIYRKSQEKTKTNVKYILRKGDGIRKNRLPKTTGF